VLEDSRFVRSVKLGALGLVAGSLSVMSLGLPALGWAQPGVLLGVLLIGSSCRPLESLRRSGWFIGEEEPATW